MLTLRSTLSEISIVLFLAPYYNVCYTSSIPLRANVDWATRAITQKGPEVMRISDVLFTASSHHRARSTVAHPVNINTYDPCIHYLWCRFMALTYSRYSSLGPTIRILTLSMVAWRTLVILVDPGSTKCTRWCSSGSAIMQGCLKAYIHMYDCGVSPNPLYTRLIPQSHHRHPSANLHVFERSCLALKFEIQSTPGIWIAVHQRHRATSD